MSGSLTERLTRRLEELGAKALTILAGLAAESGVDLYLVGGSVRDLLLDRPHIDIDLAVEAEVQPLALALAKQTGGKAVFHPRFGTATVRGPGFNIDLARTRKESYRRPGALPEVEPASLSEDLARRDFSINAMALRLTKPAGELIDPFGGKKDVAAGIVRLLHPASFQDDATRILRAVRYAARLSFRLEDKTEGWLRRDLPYLAAISGPRLRRELALVFEENAAVDAVEWLANLGVLTAIHPQLRFDAAVAPLWRTAIAGQHYAPLDELGFCLISDSRTGSEVESLARRLHLTGRVERALNDLLRLQSLSPKLAGGIRPGKALELLEALTDAAVWAFAISETGAAGKVCLRYLREWRRLRPALNGNDMADIGIPAGPAVGEALRLLRAARIEGQVKTREDEIALIRQRFALTSGR